MRKFVRECSLSLFFGVIFVASLVGQAFAGWKQLDAEQVAEGLGRLSLSEYLTSSNFAGDVAENWQSEYLQFLLYVTCSPSGSCNGDLRSPRSLARRDRSPKRIRRSASTPVADSPHVGQGGRRQDGDLLIGRSQS